MTVATFKETDLEGIGRPRAVTLDSACNMYVADSDGNRIVKYDPEGKQIAAFRLTAHDPGVEDRERGGRRQRQSVRGRPRSGGCPQAVGGR